MLDEHDKRPLYIQLVDMLQRQIEDECQPDDKLPTEKELCEEYALSRTTVRQAMSELERRGSIYRVQGKGSFVSPATPGGFNTLLDCDFSSHLEAVEAETIETELIHVCPTVSSISMLQLFGTSKRTNVCRCELRLVRGGVAAALETIYVRTSYVPGGLVTDVQSLTRTVTGLRRHVGSARERYQARLANPQEQDELSCDEGTPLLAVTRYVYGEDGELLAVIERRVLTNLLAFQNFVFTT